MMSTSQKTVSAWAPLRVGIFRALWLAVLVSNIGTWLQTVGAQWLLVHQPHALLLIAQVQMAETLSAVLFAYAGGILADTFDRRLLLLVVQGCLVVTGLAMSLLTITGQMPPALPLTPTFVLGSGSAFSVCLPRAPSTPHTVPRTASSNARQWKQNGSKMPSSGS